MWTEANSENFRDPRDVMRSRIPQTRDMQHTQYNSKKKKKNNNNNNNKRNDRHIKTLQLRLKAESNNWKWK